MTSQIRLSGCLKEPAFITGEIIAVDGGLRLGAGLPKPSRPDAA